MKEVAYKIESVTPLLMHNVESMMLKKPARISHNEWEQSDEVFSSRLYTAPDGELAIPSRVVKGMLKASAQKSGLKQTGKRSNFKDIIKAVIFVQDQFYLDQKKTDLTRENTFVSIQRSKVLRTFPKLEKWSGTVKFMIADEKQLPVEVLDELMEYGGKFVGIGDYRPEFGRYRAKRVK